MVTKIGINLEEGKIAKAGGENAEIFHNMFHLTIDFQLSPPSLL